jgi:hypothetical protein
LAIAAEITARGVGRADDEVVWPVAVPVAVHGDRRTEVAAAPDRRWRRLVERGVLGKSVR